MEAFARRREDGEPIYKSLNTWNKSYEKQLENTQKNVS
jgi:hypothetical protein